MLLGLNNLVNRIRKGYEIEESSDIDGRLIAKYTVENYFFAEKDNKGFKYQKFYFYDKIDKYVIGQTLRLK